MIKISLLLLLKTVAHPVNEMTIIAKRLTTKIFLTAWLFLRISDYDTLCHT